LRRSAAFRLLAERGSPPPQSSETRSCSSFYHGKTRSCSSFYHGCRGKLRRVLTLAVVVYAFGATREVRNAICRCCRGSCLPAQFGCCHRELCTGWVLDVRNVREQVSRYVDAIRLAVCQCMHPRLPLLAVPANVSLRESGMRVFFIVAALVFTVGAAQSEAIDRNEAYQVAQNVQCGRFGCRTLRAGCRVVRRGGFGSRVTCG
jgi:hypothetical protein